MSIIVSCQNISKSFGPKPLFSGVTFGLYAKERLGIIGPNGSGKSTLLKILAGKLDADEGVVAAKNNARFGFVAQQHNYDADDTVTNVLMRASSITVRDEREQLAVVNKVIGQTGFADPDQRCATLSGGWQKRLTIAEALVQSPEFLFLDEPTNHLDLEGISWLEELLQTAQFGCALISHDRYFLERVTTRIMEINRFYPGGLFSSEGGYSDFLERRTEYISGQQQQQASLANKVRREVEWLRSGVKARSTKQQARIQAAGDLQSNLADLNARLQSTSLDLQLSTTNRRSKKLMTLKGIGKSFPGRALFSKLDLQLSPGMRLGILGANGSGKSSLLRIIAGELPGDQGEVERVDGLRVTYFDQHREQLDPEETIKSTLAPDTDHVVFNEHAVHVATWAKRFLFQSDQLHVQVNRLSGGEQARLHIAKFLLQPADILILDEPTNDLDIETLETLEESLTEFPGAIVLVTHDRYMLARVATLILALDGNGGHQFYADYSQWQAMQKSAGKKSTDLSHPAKKKPSSPKSNPSDSPKRLTYIEQREFDQMETKIASAEATLAHWQSQVENPKNATDPAKAEECFNELTRAQSEVDKLYQRWAELEAKMT